MLHKGHITEEIHEAVTLEEAMRLLREISFDLILLDLTLPDAFGLDACKTITREFQTIPVIIVTAVDYSIFSDSAIEAGAQDYITKEQLTQRLLVKSVQYAIERFGQRQAIIESDQRKSEFVNIVSHELSSPITVILEGVELLLSEKFGPLNAKQRSLIEMEHSSGKRLQKLIIDMLNISRLEAGRLELTKTTFSLNELLQVVAREYEGRIQERGLALKLELPPQDIELNGDRDRIYEVVGNLLSNALKYTESGEVTISLIGFDTKVAISVSDTGQGISKENQLNLFKKFSRFSKNYDRRQSSTGLGLWISKEIVEMHEGTIIVESQVGEGTKFTLNLPRQVNQEDMRENG
ncbi:MAG: Sensor histidine kinase RcsC [Chlamydiia bacterium]|nr:Sensor histidine kinase RcsC [Chlamydiia bacterium]